MPKMKWIIFIFTLPPAILCCKSRAPTPIEPPCPDGFWKVPDGYKCIGVSGSMTDCAKNHKCMNYAYLCDGERNLMYEKDKFISESNYTDGTPDETFCTDEFCANLADGRTKRCPETTRCITPTVNLFPGTAIPIGPMCSEVKIGNNDVNTGIREIWL